MGNDEAMGRADDAQYHHDQQQRHDQRQCGNLVSAENALGVIDCLQKRSCHNSGQADFTTKSQVRAAQHNDTGNAAGVDDLGRGLGQDGGKVRNADKGRLDCNNDQQQCANDKIQRIVVEPIHNFFGFQH